MFKPITAFLLGIFATQAPAADLTVSGARVTKVQVYEAQGNAWIHLNGNSRVGPDPNNASVTCELWTTDKTVIATALSAMLASTSVDVIYVDNSNGSFWCKVQAFAVNEH